jgi:hypothetical protein
LHAILDTGEEFESMRKMNFSLRLQPSLMEEAHRAAASEGVSLNQLINVAVAEKLSALRTDIYLHERIRLADHEETLRILDRAVKGNPPMEGGKVPSGGLHASPETFSARVQPAPVAELAADGEGAEEIGKPSGRATPQFGKLKRQLEKARGR